MFISQDAGLEPEEVVSVRLEPDPVAAAKDINNFEGPIWGDPVMLEDVRLEPG